jgi:hypothetical protein
MLSWALTVRGFRLPSCSYSTGLHRGLFSQSSSAAEAAAELTESRPLLGPTEKGAASASEGRKK